jgi:prolyl oligopeptidase
MNKTILTALTIGVLSSCMQTHKNTDTNITVKTVDLEYPVTREGDVVDTYFGKEVADPYRWLEDDMSQETANWVVAENKVTHGYLNQIPYRDQIKERLTKLINYEKISAPFKEGKYTYFYKNNGLQNQYVVYRKTKGGTQEVFLDPNTFSEDGTVSLGQLSFSKDGSIAAYAISIGGSDWRQVKIIDVETKKQIEDTLVDIKFSGLSWYKNEGFYYSSYDKPKGSELSAKTDQHKLYYHKLGTKQVSDKVVFGAIASEKHRYVGGSVTEDNRYLFISASVSTNGNKLFLKDLTQAKSPLVTVLDHTDSNTYVIDNQGSKLYLVTDLDAPNKKVVTVDATNPQASHWVDFIAETENVLSASTGSDYFFTSYMVDAVTQVKQYNYEGKLVKNIELPGVGTASGFGGKKEDATLYYSFSNYVTPGTIYAYEPKSGTSKVYNKPKIDFDSDAYESKQVFYHSKDGTKIPMIISHKKGLKLDGTNPAILYGYGGFNISLTPRFSTTRAVWMELGGIYAVANLRGGGEYGTKWHDAGTQLNKQNVFDDFITAGEYLLENKYTSKQKLGIMGGSNGGLLVGAVMTQRPDLMQVALPAVGVLDMLRYHTFTAGAGWAYDYGTSEQSKEMFEYLLNYSPVHNVKQGVDYPATLVTTGDHDDRVVPAHSFKFAAELQAKGSKKNPLLIRIETDAGHGAGTPISKTIDQYADIYAFTLWNMGIKNL